MSELKITLPDALAKDAQAAGLLEPRAIERLLREAIRQRAAGELFEAMDKLAALNLPPMSEDEIQAEIEAVRRERRAIG